MLAFGAEKPIIRGATANKNESERKIMKRIRLTVFLMAGLMFSTLTSRAQTNGFITNGLIAYYPLDGTANDESGFGNNGTVFGASLTTDRFGVPGRAYYFNGTNDYILANVPTLPTGAAPRSASLWARAQPPSPLAGMLVWWGCTNGGDCYGQSFCIIDNV